MFEEDSLSSYRSRIYLPAIYLPFVFLLKRFLILLAYVHPWIPDVYLHRLQCVSLHSTPVRQRHSINILLYNHQEDIRSLVTHLSAPSCLSLWFHSSVQINYLLVSLTICVSPFCYRRSDPYRMHRMSSTIDPATVLLSITQDGRPIEYYVEEFLQLANQVPWNDGTLKVVFWTGLNDHLYLLAPAATTPGSLAQYIDYVLLLAGSPLTVGAIDEDDKVAPVPKSTPVEGISIPKSKSEMTVTKIIPPPETAMMVPPPKTAMMVPPPETAMMVPPPVTVMMVPPPATKIVPPPETAMMVPPPVTVMMVPPPATKIVPPPETAMMVPPPETTMMLPAARQCPPVPAPRMCPPVPAPRMCPPVPAPRKCPPVPAPPEHPLVPAPPERPLVPAPSERPLVPAPPERPTEPAPPEWPLEGNLPKKIFLGGHIPLVCVAGPRTKATELPDLPWPPEKNRPWPPEPPVPPWPPESPDPPWPPEAPDPPWPPEPPDPPWPPEPPVPLRLPELPVPPGLPEPPVPPWLLESPDPPWRLPQSLCQSPASRAPTPPPRYYYYGAGRAFREGEVMLRVCLSSTVSYHTHACTWSHLSLDYAHLHLITSLIKPSL